MFDSFRVSRMTNVTFEKSVGRSAGSDNLFGRCSWGFAALHPRLYAGGRSADSLNLPGLAPVQRLKARENAAASEKPNK
jgi:hypothetical protein